MEGREKGGGRVRTLIETELYLHDMTYLALLKVGDELVLLFLLVFHLHEVKNLSKVLTMLRITTYT